MNFHFAKCLILALLAAALFGCAGERQRSEGLDLMAAGSYEEGLAKLNEAVAEVPTSADFRKDLLAQRAAALEKLGTAAAQARQAGRGAEAETLFKRMLAIEPGNPRAQAGLDALARDRRHAEAMTLAREAVKAGDLDQAQRLIRSVLLENPEHADTLALRRELAEQEAKKQASEPTLKSTYTKPINLEIRDANVKMIFESLARSTGINFILDKDVRPDLRTTVFLRNASIEDAIDLIVQTSQLKRKVLNINTVLVYPNTAEKAKDYQELVVKGFYLQNADVKLVQTSLKALLKTKDIVVDEKLNLIIVRDTPEAIRLAEKLIAMHDLSEPEVMLEVEVLEVQRSRLLDLGVQWPSQLTLTPLSATGGTSLLVEDFRHLNATRIGAAFGSTTINLRRDLSDANILANPRIRARNREKAKIMIGDKLPVVTTTTTATGLVSDSIQYLDVGIKLDVEPDVRLKDEVVIKVALEVSSIAKEVRTPSGSLAYQVGTRNASTVLRLKDGETQILGGLISDQERSSAARIPLFGDIPILGRLFGSQKDDKSKSEIVLSITPRLIRNLALPDAGNGEFWSGTESYLRTKPLTLQNMMATATAVREGAAAPVGGLLSALRAEPQMAAKSVNLAWQGPAQVKVGEEFKLALRLKSDGTLRGLPLQIGFDAKAFQVVDVIEGGFFRQNGGATSFTKSVDADAGKIFVSIVRSEADGAQGDDAVLTLMLRALPSAPTGEVRVLKAAPIIQGDKPPPIALPPNQVVTITP